ncbi:MAG: hypothetical protein M5U26_23875 [Planctomycetota bacterium]|nr:hypothetical protein [Planctomycetota bacterium]
MILAVASAMASAEYADTVSVKDLPPGAVAVTEPGYYAEPGKTYVLMRDLSSEMTALFLGKDVTLDLNGHTVTFAAGPYEHVPNYGFEEGLRAWDVSRAPGAKATPSNVRPMVGEGILELKAGDELVSPFITLPVANRSYYAMCAVATNTMHVSIRVEDEKGQPVRCEFKGGSVPRVYAPEEQYHPELGGGVVFAHLHHLPAGKYRIRIKAETDCLIDECDIRPALDAGIAVVGAIEPYATYADVVKFYPCAFFDYNKTGAQAGVPVDGLPMVKGKGTITIKNGIVKAGTVGIRTLGVQSNAPEVTVLLDNVKIVNAGINANAARIAKATLRNCRFEVDTPFIVNRHDTSETSVSVGSAMEVSGCAFMGGQGNFSGSCPAIHDNLFVNAQTVTNHYSISPYTGTKIYRNRFEPTIGSGIYIGGGHDVEVYENVFRIETSPPNCEYRYSGYSTNAIRLSDYNSKRTAPDTERCAGNRVYKNKIYITGKAYPQFKGYTPATYAFHYSCGGGTNYIHDNEIFVDLKDQGSNVAITAFFISGGTNSGGEWFGNKVVSNVPPVQVSGRYGPARFDKIYANTFIKAPNAPPGMQAVRMGSWDEWNEATATDIEFYSNRCEGFAFGIEATKREHSYTVGWTLTLKVLDASGAPSKGQAVLVQDAQGKGAASLKTDSKGLAKAMLPAYRVHGTQRTDCAAYTVVVGDPFAGGTRHAVKLDEDTEISVRLK